MSSDKRFRPVGMGWWVDPRICSVRGEDLQSYLLAHGWRIKPQPRAEMVLFENVSDEDAGRLSVPAAEQSSDYIQRLIETVTALASHEQRYAVDVLEDILDHDNDNAADANGRNARQKKGLPVP